MAKTRSPNYPALSFPDAIEKASRIYQRDHLNEMPPEVAAEHMGYSGLNGASLTAISALKKYGLLEGRGGALKVTKEAQVIIEKMPDAEDLLAQLAFKPVLWGEIATTFDGELPSENNLRAFLLKKGFNPKKVDLVAKTFIATVEFAQDPPSEYRTQQGRSANRPTGSGGAGVQATEITEFPSKGAQSMVLPMGRDFVATITFSGEITQMRLDKLIRFVELARDEYPEDTGQDARAALESE